MLLGETLSNQPHFVFFNGSINSSFPFEEKFAFNGFTPGEVDQLAPKCYFHY
ncbi:hypothetical protein Scep_013139 [Stephania cephalantha]|uniref:Uncharacterized protein n=1 Tax=Stephania cephalantha TaxID=152367 RepID=A0AAP0JGH4_9MAGN